MRAGGFTLIRAWIPAFAGMAGTGGMRGSRLRRGATEGGLIPGPIWPWLASFTPTVEAGNEANQGLVWHSAHSYAVGQPALVVALVGLVGVGRSGETFNSVAFGCISSHFPNPHPNPLPEGEGICMGDRDARFPPSRERRGPWRDEVCGHCSNQRGYGAMGSCRGFGDGTTSRTLNSYERTPANQLRGV